MKPRDLLPVVERVRRATTNGDVLTICDALSKRLSHEIATSRPKSSDDVIMRELAKFVENEPATPMELACGLVIRQNGKKLDPRDVFIDKPGGTSRMTVPLAHSRPATAMDAVVEHAESGRKPATGKAKRALAKLSARKAARKSAKS